MKKESRDLIFWSHSHKKYISDIVWDKAERILEVPDNIDMDNIRDIAEKLSPIIFEEIANSKSENKDLKILPFVSESFNSILFKVLENYLHPNDGELVLLKINKKSHDAPTVMIDDATISESILKHGVVDFDKEPLPDRPLFNDGLDNNSLQKPEDL